MKTVKPKKVIIGKERREKRVESREKERREQ